MIWESMEWALTPDAQDALTKLKAKGMDPDLAFTILDLTWPEDRMYEKPQEQDET